MRSCDYEDSVLDPVEEACLRRVMTRLRARLSETDSADGECAGRGDAARQHAATCGEIVID